MVGSLSVARRFYHTTRESELAESRVAVQLRYRRIFFGFSFRLANWPSLHLAHCSLELHGICGSEFHHPMRHRRSAAARSAWRARFIFRFNTCCGCKSAPPHVPVGHDPGRASGRAAVRTPCVFARQALLFVSISSGYQFSHCFSDFGLNPGSEQSLHALAKVPCCVLSGAFNLHLSIAASDGVAGA
jgi:hypothetical protein